MKKRIAIVGAGIFGTTIGMQLANKSNQVDIFEKDEDILQATSSINEYRVHRGYHYPRSLETATSALTSEQLFKNFYPDAIIDTRDHFYAIAKEQSLTSSKKYIEFCSNLSLEFEETELELLDQTKIELTIKVKESLFDPIVLKKLVWKKLYEKKVNVLLKTKATPSIYKEYDFVILCTYANLNQMLKGNRSYQKEYQFEICEKPIVKLPRSFHNKSLVIMDGPFMCIDPYRSTSDQFVMGNVVHAIHSRNTGKYPKIPKALKSLLNRGLIRNPNITNFEAFISSGIKFMPDLAKAKHIGSMYTIRTVLPNKDKTDERPTIVKRLNQKTVSVFSGKISNCVEAADKVSEIVNS